MCIIGRALALPYVPDIMQALAAPRVPATQAVGRGPQAALKVWQSERRSVGQTRTWLEEARMEAVLGSCRRSLPSVRCACMNCVLVQLACIMLLDQGRDQMLFGFRGSDRGRQCGEVPAQG